MSATRLLVLGAVRTFKPIHGYDLRRELMSWHADEWATISFGSIYFALKKMTAERVLEAVETERSGGRPEKTLYRLTAAGEKEFQSLLREYFWRRKPLIDPFLVAMSQMPALPKPELVAALRHRSTSARALAEELRFQAKARLAVKSHFAGEELAGRYVPEMMELSVGRLLAEADWADSLAGRIESGVFPFPDEPYPPGYGAGGMRTAPESSRAAPRVSQGSARRLAVAGEPSAQRPSRRASPRRKPVESGGQPV
jgi:DNA-binding PadR family transcriptional regulator